MKVGKHFPSALAFAWGNCDGADGQKLHSAQFRLEDAVHIRTRIIVGRHRSGRAYDAAVSRARFGAADAVPRNTCANELVAYHPPATPPRQDTASVNPAYTACIQT